jgi:hypothetical protein
MQCANRSIALTLPSGLASPSEQIRSLSSPNRPGLWGLSSSLGKICSWSRCKSMLRQGDRAATTRCKSRFSLLSSNGTTPQVDQATHTEAFADLPQLRAAGREETAQQPIPAQLLDLNLPALGAATEPLKNPGQLRRDRGFSFAKKPAGVVDQLELPRNHRRPPRRSPQVP